MTARSLVVAAALFLTATTPVAARNAPPSPAAPAKPAAEPSKPVAPDKSAWPPPPVVFFLARGDANACGVGCSEWIAADGTLDVGADERLRVLLKKLGGRKLPIFFHSPGGKASAALGIGRLLRQHGLTAGVGWTVPAGCDPKQRREPACDKLKRSGRDLVAVLDTSYTMCSSGCVYALVGAAVRELGPGVRLGVHAISFSIQYIDLDGNAVRTPTRMTPAAERKAYELWYGKIGAYLREMGISQDLLAAAREIESTRIRYLRRDEIVAFGIDRRQTVESMWLFAEQTSGPIAFKFIEENRAGAFRKDYLRLSCRSASTLRLLYGRDLADAPFVPVRLRLTASAGTFVLGGAFRGATSGSSGAVEVRSVDLPISVLGDPAFTIEVAEKAAPALQAGKGTMADGNVAPVTEEGPVSIATVKVQGAGAGLGELARRCGNEAPKAKDVPTQRI
jgi:hypothetical protein